MDKTEFDMHIAAGVVYGRERTCGTKTDFKSEERAIEVAPVLSRKFGHEMEAYPCAFCAGWHVGREMTAEEREKFSASKTPCSRDTNGDGDCGRPLCPECGSQRP